MMFFRIPYIVLQRFTELPQHAIGEHYLNHSFDASSTFKNVFLQVYLAINLNFHSIDPLPQNDVIRFFFTVNKCPCQNN